MSVLTKTGINSVLGTPAADQILVSNPDDALAGLIDGIGGFDELRFTSTIGEYLIFGSNISNVESVVIGTGAGVVAITTGTTAEAVDASMALNALAITGNAGANEIVGTAYADTITGGKGNDVLYGGDGNDSFVVGVALDHGVNEVIDGEDGYDTLVFASTTVGDTLVVSAYTDVEAVTISPASGATALNVNANEVMNGTGLLITGNAGGNVLTGSFWGDVLVGGAGNDTLKGGIGDDRFMIGAPADYGNKESIDGGLGNDTIVFGGAAGQTLVLNAGTTLVEQVLIRNPSAPDAGANLDARNVAAGAGGAGLVLAGNNGANILTGSGGRDRLEGNGGNDIFLVTTVSQVAVGETISGGDGQDEIRFAVTTPGETLVLDGRIAESVERIAIGTGTAPAAVLTGTTALNVDATGVALDLTYLGNAGPNNIKDDTGNAFMEGGAGNDTLEGGDGNDTLVGGVGNDFLNGGSGDTVFLYRAATEGGAGEVIVTVGGTNTLRFAGPTGILSVPQYEAQQIHFIDLPGANATAPVGVNAAIWNGGALIVGNAGSNSITGTSGNDTLVGGAGADSLSAGPGADFFQIASAAHSTGDNYAGGLGFDTVLLGAAGAYVFAATTTGIELITWSTPADASPGANINAAAVATALALEGTAGANVLAGGGGNDTITGGGGPDTLTGGAGNDRFVIVPTGYEVEDDGSENPPIMLTGNGIYSDQLDLINGGPGFDTIVLDTTPLALPVGAQMLGLFTIPAASAANTAFEAVTLEGPDNIGVTAAAYSGALVITGNDGDNYIVGGAGNDTLVGGGGDDVFAVSGAGPSGNDAMDGGLGYDYINYFPVAPGETLAPQALSGVEQVYMGDSPFAEGIPIPANFSAAASTNGLMISGNSADNALNGSRFGDAIYGENGNDTLVGGAGADTLAGDDGNDVLSGGSGNDTLAGGAGNDTLVGNAGDDVFEDPALGDFLIGGRGTDTLRYTDGGLDLSAGDLPGLRSVETLDLTGVGDNLFRVASIDDFTPFLDSSGPIPLFTTITVTGDAGDRIETLADFGTPTSTDEDYVTYDLLGGVLKLDRDIQLYFSATGDALGNTLSGTAGDDSLSGAGGNDTLVAGNGNDTLAGGTGDDIFRLSGPWLDPTTDVIADFEHGVDRVQLSHAVFTSLAVGSVDAANFASGPGAEPTDTDDFLVYDTTTGNLYYAPFGNAFEPQFIAALTGHPTLTASDFEIIA